MRRSRRLWVGTTTDTVGEAVKAAPRPLSAVEGGRLDGWEDPGIVEVEDGGQRLAPEQAGGPPRAVEHVVGQDLSGGGIGRALPTPGTDAPREQPAGPVATI